METNTEHSYQLILKNIGSNPVEVLRVINSTIEIDNKTLTSILESNFVLFKDINEKQAQSFLKIFRNLGAQVELIPNEQESYYPFGTHLLFPQTHNYIAAMYQTYESFYYITENGSLMYYRKYMHNVEQKGCVRMRQRLPIKDYTNFEIGRTTKGELLLVMYDKKTNKLELRNIADEWSIFPFPILQNETKYDKLLYIHNDYAFYLSANKSVHHKISWNGKKDEEWNVEPIIGRDKLEYIWHVCEQKLENIEEVWKVYQPKNVITSLKEVYIDENDNLILSAYQLIFSEDGKNCTFEFANPNIPKKKIASKISKNEFIFEDNSKVYFDKDGMIVLISRYGDVSDIYITATLDENIGMATDEKFAGNKYYAPAKVGAFYHYTVALQTIDLADFKEKYIDEFVSDILDYLPYENDEEE